MQIIVNRGEPRPGTYWAPAEPTIHQRQMIESVRREISGDRPDIP